jgi:hypothetical protein
MSDYVRRLNADGTEQFRKFVVALKEGGSPAAIKYLLVDPSTSSPIDHEAQIDQRSFSNRFSFGEYLVERLAPLDRRQISRDHGLWSWLALYYFDQLCPPGTSVKDISAAEAYILSAKYNFRDYYRHLVRTPWMVVSDHGRFAKVLLIPASAGKGIPLGVRGEIIEQLASRQAILRNRRIIEAAYRLYWDENSEKPRRGAAGKKDANGPPRRLGIVLRQLDLTLDLDVVDPARLVQILPREFAKWRERT